MNRATPLFGWSDTSVWWYQRRCVVGGVWWGLVWFIVRVFLVCDMQVHVTTLLIFSSAHTDKQKLLKIVVN